ncbi:hypothetical protein V0288_11620 [Pannus brasiliensis CCIBt3594]|uniref:Uncharacterized protein n=1 Tax=Pannus brasiliensis CCIBt3594 TaxID=1427578 RepID=A0AAW9QW74_9CHRO
MKTVPKSTKDRLSFLMNFIFTVYNTSNPRARNKITTLKNDEIDY